LVLDEAAAAETSALALHDALPIGAAAGAAAVAAAFTASSSACEDEYKPEMRGGRDLCGELALSGQCHKNLVHLSCAKTCNMCSSSSAPTGGCEDFASTAFCQAKQAQGRCHKLNNKAHCPLTCAACPTAPAAPVGACEEDIIDEVSCKKKVIADPLNCLNNAHVQATCPRTCLKHGYILPCQLVTEARRQMALEAAARYEHAHEGAESDEATEALEEAAA